MLHARRPAVVSAAPLLVLVLLPALAPGARAQSECDLGAWTQELDAGVSGPVLWLREGEPVVGAPFAAAVRGGAPGAPGAMVYGAASTSAFVPPFGATVFVAQPFLVEPFLLDAHGDSGPILPLAALPASLCGAQLVFQAGVVDPAATGGIAVTNGLRLRLGELPGIAFAGPKFPAGDSPSDVTVSDLDNDGVLDLATSSATGSGGDLELSVLRGNGDGTFVDRTVVPMEDASYALVAADLDGDGTPDLAAAHKSSRIGVALGKGDGTYFAATTFASGDRPYDVAALDLDLDGHLDLVAPSDQDEDVSVWLGNGDGTFGPRVTHPTLASPLAVAGADFDADGSPDLAVTFVDGGVTIHPGSGDGTFGPLSAVLDLGAFGVPAGTWDVVAGDLDADGAADVAFVNTWNEDVSFVPGDGDGTFGPTSDFPTDRRPESIAAADLDGDGKADLAVGLEGGDVERTVQVLLGLGGPGLPAFGEPTSHPAGEASTSIATADLDGDGDVDLVASATSNDVAVLLGEGDGGFPAGAQHDVGGGEGPRALAFGDLDGDGDQDVVTANDVSGDVTVLLSAGDGSFPQTPRYGAGGRPSGVAAADLDGDGDLDLVVSNQGTDDITALRNLGDGTFATAATAAAGEEPSDLAVADLDDDGFLDLAVSNLESDDVSILLGTGTGTFHPQTTYPVGSGSWLGSLAIGDLDGDGAEDLAVTTEFVDRVAVLGGDGAGAFGPAVLHPVGDSPESVAIGDLDGDGRLDLVTNHWISSASPGGVVVSLGKGDLTFQPPALHDAARAARDVALADVDGDGTLDVAASNWSTPSEVSISYGFGDGDLQERIGHPVGAYAHDVSLVDLDGDGRPDAVVASEFTHRITVLRNRLDG